MTRGRETLSHQETMEAGTIVRVIKVSHLILIRAGADSRSCIALWFLGSGICIGVVIMRVSPLHDYTETHSALESAPGMAGSWG